MKKSAVVIAPGRGTYNKAELGYLARHHPSIGCLSEFDDYRQGQGQTPISELDRSERFLASLHTRGDNASPGDFHGAVALMRHKAGLGQSTLERRAIGVVAKCALHEPDADARYQRLMRAHRDSTAAARARARCAPTTARGLR